MNQEQAFTGFSEETGAFLKNLKTHNNKQWFERHRQEYETFLLKPFRQLVMDLSSFMLMIDPYLEVRPAVNKTISKIYRDTRFSRSKLPFKTSMWITFKRPNKDWKDAPAYFFEISPHSYRFGMGLYSASPDTMRQFRGAIDANPKEFLKAISFYSDQNVFVLEGERYKRIISQDKSPEIREWYQRKNFYLVCNRKIDARLFGRELIDDLMSGFNRLAPFYHYLWNLRGLRQ